MQPCTKTIKYTVTIQIHIFDDNQLTGFAVIYTLTIHLISVEVDMKTSELLKTIDSLDREGVWLFSIDILSPFFASESRQSMAISLDRQVKAGVLVKVKKGLYANERALSAPVDKLPALVPYLRPGFINYLSLESRLSELGVISQMPLSSLTLMTTGRSQVFTTRYGRIEFTHTSRKPTEIIKSIELDESTGLYVASPERAYRDLSRVGRNLNLVDHEILNDLITGELNMKGTDHDQET